MAARHDPDWPRHGEVLFENVTLHYESSFTPALDHLTLSLPAGTMVRLNTPSPIAFASIASCSSLPSRVHVTLFCR